MKNSVNKQTVTVFIDFESTYMKSGFHAQTVCQFMVSSRREMKYLLWRMFNIYLCLFTYTVDYVLG